MNYPAVTKADAARFRELFAKHKILRGAFVLCDELSNFAVLPLDLSEEVKAVRVTDCAAKGFRPCGVLAMLSTGEIVSESLEDIVSQRAVRAAGEYFSVGTAMEAARHSEN
jgi:hypothetical protein